MATNSSTFPLDSTREVITDKWKVELNTKNYSDISITWIGHMIATPTQFFTNFFSRKDYCIQYVIRGKGDYFTNNRLHHLKKGTLWLLPKEQYHYYISNKEDPYEYYWLHINGKGAEMFLDSIGLTETTPVIHNLNNPNLELKFNKLIEISKKDNPDENLVLSALHSLLYTIKESLIDRHHKQKTNDRNVAIDNAIQYIKENYAKDISLQDLASIAHLDKIYFTKKFKKATRLSPIQFLIQYRISQSCNMLHSSLPLKSIAIQCGFKNLTNFLRHFKDFIGLTPTQYRKNITPLPKKQLKKTNHTSH